MHPVCVCDLQGSWGSSTADMLPALQQALTGAGAAAAAAGDQPGTPTHCLHSPVPIWGSLGWLRHALCALPIR